MSASSRPSSVESRGSNRARAAPLAACRVVCVCVCVLFAAATAPPAHLAHVTSSLAAAANANAGGENVHRGLVLGALVGAQAGASGIPEALKAGLHHRAAIEAEIDAFVAARVGGGGAKAPAAECSPTHVGVQKQA